MNNKLRIFSGIQPSGNLHIGNYLGAIKNWVKLQHEYDSIFCVVDLHAITIPQDPKELRKKTLDVARVYLAAGIDPEKCSLFIQSHVSEHAELMWILNTIAKNGDLTKMTQFKDKSSADFDVFEKSLKYVQERKEKPAKLKIAIEKLDAFKAEELGSTSAFETARHFFQQFKEQFNKQSFGLLGYPVLMAADILLYNTEIVPVGKDQVQHIELTRKLAERFNSKFGETFILPKPFTTTASQSIMGLDDPAKKMSKSAASEYNYINLTDDEETVKRKIKKAVTDSGSEIIYSEDPPDGEASKPALKNLINIYSLFSDKKPKDIEKDYKGKGYADFKNGLAEVIIGFLKPFQKKMAEYSDKKVLEILKQGAERVRPIAKAKLDEAKKKIGFVI